MFVPGDTFQPSLIFVDSLNHSQINWKVLPRLNTLAYLFGQLYSCSALPFFIIVLYFSIGYNILKQKKMFPRRNTLAYLLVELYSCSVCPGDIFHSVDSLENSWQTKSFVKVKHSRLFVRSQCLTLFHPSLIFVDSLEHYWPNKKFCQDETL